MSGLGLDEGFRGQREATVDVPQRLDGGLDTAVGVKDGGLLR